MPEKMRINTDWCKGCSYCAQTCPRKAISMDGDVNSSGYVTARADQSKCIACGLCYIVCPDYAITVYKGDKDNG